MREIVTMNEKDTPEELLTRGYRRGGLTASFPTPIRKLVSRKSNRACLGNQPACRVTLLSDCERT
jgi:hypothetical protein